MVKTETVTLEALGNQVVVKMDEVEEITQGGIILTEGVQEAPMIGTVVSRGIECKHVENGDRVFIPHLAGVRIEVHGIEARVVMEEEILVRIK